MELCGKILSAAAQDQVVLGREAGLGSISACPHDFLLLLFAPRADTDPESFCGCGEGT